MRLEVSAAIGLVPVDGLLVINSRIVGNTEIALVT